MAQFPELNQLAKALTLAKQALNLSSAAQLNLSETHVFLKHLLLEGLEPGEIRYWRQRWRQEACAPLRTRLQQRLNKLLTHYPDFKAIPVEQVHSLLSTGVYQQRLVDLTLEAVLSEALAPELCLHPTAQNPDCLKKSLPGSKQHAVIFASAYFFSHELYPLVVDAYVHDIGQFGSQRSNVLGVHQDWLNADQQLTRIIYFDFSAHRFLETALTTPIPPDSVHFLCLGAEEQHIHQRLAQRFSCRQLNPYPPSALADDKAATLAGWQALGLTIPASQEILPGDYETAYAFFQDYTEIVVKPNFGTEGRDVRFFRHGGDSPQDLAEHLQHCWKRGIALVQQRRDGVCYLDPTTGVRHSLSIRLNLCRVDEQVYKVVSGYAQLAVNTQQPAACGVGGSILDLATVLGALCIRTAEDDQSLITFDTANWLQLRAYAAQAAGLFNGLLLMGLDVLLDVDATGRLIPVFLEANPRPAGLSHSRLLEDDPFRAGEIGVGLRY